ncbi:serine/threonine-protein kinase mps1 [Apis mellifera caucasica]|nr:serine/threonine-protein kinase mps1 [Apis mellifera caucasica]
MCTTEMTESYTMSPSRSTVSSSATTPGCLGGSPVNRRTPCRGSPGRGDVQDDEDEISVGCPSPLPLVVVAPAADEEERLSQSRDNEYVDRLSPRRSYPRESVIDDEDSSYSRGGDYRMSNGRGLRGVGHEGSGGGDSVTTLREDEEEEDEEEDEEEVNSRTSSNGGAADDYFKPLKRLKMVQMQHSDEEDERDRDTNERGVKSFSILDILSHRPKAKIVRPWDTVESNHHHLNHHHLNHRHHLHQQQQQQQQQQHHHHHHHLHHHHHHSNHSTPPRDLSLMGMSLASMSAGSISEPPLSSSSSSGRSSVSDSGSPDPLGHHHHGMHHGMHPGLHHPVLQQQQQQQQQQQFKRKTSQQHGSQSGHHGKRTTGQGSPLDALFQMTSKTFDAGEHSQGERFFFFFLSLACSFDVGRREKGG